MTSRTRDEAFDFACEATRQLADLLVARLFDFAEASPHRFILQKAGLTVESEFRSLSERLSRQGAIGVDDRHEMVSEIYTILRALNEASGFVKYTIRERDVGERATARKARGAQMRAAKSKRDEKRISKLEKAVKDEAAAVKRKIAASIKFARVVRPGVLRRLKKSAHAKSPVLDTIKKAAGRIKKRERL